MRYLERNDAEKKPWVTRDILDLGDEKRDSKKKRYDEEGEKDYRKAIKRVKKALQKSKENWIETQCKKIDACLNKNNS